MALKVRDEGDVIEDNLRVHHALGVERFIITDNGSRDETLEVLRRFEDAGLAHVIHEEGPFREGVMEWMNRMARLAATDFGAEWVLHGDADEFWLPAAGTLAETLGCVRPEYGAVVAPRSEFMGRPDGPGPFHERLTVREARASLRPKLAHRADPRVVVLDRGAHNVASLDDDTTPRHGSERAVLRGAHAPGIGGDDVRFVWAPWWPLRVLHFPVRSLAQIRRRIEVLLYEAGFTDKGRRARLRERYEAEGAERIYAGLIAGDEAVRSGLETGEMVRDARLSELLARCPDPLGPEAPAPGSVRVQPAPDDLAAELAMLEQDAMRAISRAHFRVTMAQKRLLDRVERLERRLAAATEETA